MPVCTLHLLSLTSSLPNFLPILHTSSPTPLISSRVIRWIITPTLLSIDPLLTQNPTWDILLLYGSDTPLPAALLPHISAHWSLKAGIPSRIINSFPATNATLLHPSPNTIPSLPSFSAPPHFGTSAQNLELSPALDSWIRYLLSQPSSANSWIHGAVSMLNLLSFLPGAEAKASYLEYGAAFSESIGSKRGGNAKIVGKVLEVSDGETRWDELTVAHYPSLAHFADMIGSEDYQAVNLRKRVLALRDTCILFTSELAVEEVVGKLKL